MNWKDKKVTIPEFAGASFLMGFSGVLAGIIYRDKDSVPLFIAFAVLFLIAFAFFICAVKREKKA